MKPTLIIFAILFTVLITLFHFTAQNITNDWLVEKYERESVLLAPPCRYDYEQPPANINGHEYYYVTCEPLTSI